MYKRISVGCAHYERVYDSLAEAICAGGEKGIQDWEVLEVLGILEQATEVAKEERKP